MPSPIRPNQFCDAVPAANADLCTRFSKLLNLPQLLCDLFGWMLTSTGELSSDFKAEVATYSAPTGAYLFSATMNVGDGWLYCDGSEVSRTTYAALFAEIGTRYGDGDASTTFNLPDGRSRSLLASGQGTGLTDRSINSISGGAETHPLTESENGPHAHTYIGPVTRTEERGDGANNVWRGSDPTAETDSSGSGSPHNNMHPFLIAHLFIKT